VDNIPLKIFISYSHEDEQWKNRLQKYLNVQVQLNRLIIWDDREIRTGEEWNPAIEKAILESDIAILLVSVDFLNSSFIQNQEIPCIQKNNVKIMPLIISPCPWDDFDYISTQQGFTKNNQPLEELNINKELNRIVKELCCFEPLELSLEKENCIDLKYLKNELTEILFWDEIDVDNCVLADNKTTIDVVLRQIWNGNRRLIDKLIGMGKWFDNKPKSSECIGGKDIFNDWNKNNIKTIIFYIPSSTVTRIRKKLVRKISTKTISEKIESYILSQTNMIIYNLDNENYEIENIFDIKALKNELNKNRKDSNKIFFIGLKYDLSSKEIDIYINNIPISERNGMIFGNSKILKHKLKKGIMGISIDENITIEFFNTNEFSSKDIDLKNIDFEGDSIKLDYTNSSLILESKEEKSLSFSRERKGIVDEERIDSSSIVKITRVNMNSFFVPKKIGLKSVNLLLLKKDGQNIIAGGQYHSGLRSCNVVAELIIDFKKESICVKNHSNTQLYFSNYKDFWRLEEFSLPNSSNYSSGIYTDILSSMGVLNNANDGLTDIKTLNVESTLIIEKGDKHTFNINEIEFNDSNVSFDKYGVLIQYSSFCIGKFKKEFALHRTAYVMSNNGTIIDCFVSQSSQGVFKYGSRVFDNSSSILGILISSQPIYIRYIQNGLEIDVTNWVTIGYIVKILASSKEYILETTDNTKKIIKRDEMKDLEIEVISNNLNKPLITFSLEFD